MTIRAVVFDIGGILEITPRHDDPTADFPALHAAWDARLNMARGELDRRMQELDARLQRMGKDGAIGTCTEQEWLAELPRATDMTSEQLDAYIRDFWDVYCGQPNDELIAYFRNLRPRYQTALLSNSFVGARREEQQRYHFDEITNLIIYSHEVGMAKPDPRIFALTCQRLCVQPAEMVFLDDSAQHVAAARELGIHAILFRDNAQAIADIQACL
ncbi:MAG: HAD family phosphatase [Ktedonobacterales bacterium]